MSDKNIISSPFPSVDIPIISVGEYMLNQLKKFNNSSPVLIDGITGESLTALQLITQANKVAVSLLNRGITKSDVICYFSANSIPYAILKFAAYFLGVTSVHSKPTNNVFEFENVVTNSKPTFVFISAVNAPIVEKVLQKQNIQSIKFVSVFEGSYEHYFPFDSLITESTSDENLAKIPYFDVNPREDICEIIYTSGTSGIPKGATYSHYSFVSALILTFQNENYVSDQQIAICVMAFGHLGGTMMLPLYLSRGTKLVLHNQFDEFEDILKSVEKYKVTYFPILLLYGHQLIEGPLVDKYDLSSLKIVMQGGTHFPDFIARAIIKKYNVDFIIGYGMTECIPVVKNCSTEYIDGSCGLIAPNAKLKIVDLNTGKPLGANQTGEICVKSPAIFSGYLRNKAAFDEVIDTDGFLHTGDVGHYDECGRLYCTDRIKEMIKFGLSSVAPAEIEQQLLRHKAIEQTVVVGVQQQTGLQYPRAFVVTKPGHNVTAEELQNFIKENMSDYNQLRGGVVFVDHILRTLIGKADRQHYRRLVNQIA